MNGELKKDGVDVTRQGAEFFLEQGGEMQTAPITPEEFQEYFSNLLKRHDHILAVLVSDVLSQNMSNARQAVEALGASERITLYDSRIGTVALGRMALRARQLLDENKPVAEVVQELERHRQITSCKSVVPTLKYFRKGKRVSAGRAIIATLLRLCPVMDYTDDGKLAHVSTVRGKDGIQKLIADLEEQYGKTPVAVTIGLAGDSEEQISRMRKALEESQLNVKQIHQQGIGPSSSAHSGPGVYGYVVEPYHEGLLI